MSLVRRFFREYVAVHWGKLLVAFLLTGAVNQAPFAFSMLGKWLVDDVLGVGQSGSNGLTTDEQISQLWVFLAISLALRTGQAGLGGLSGYLISSTGQRVLFSLRSTVQEKLTDLSLAFYDRYSTGQLMVRVMGDASAAQANAVNMPVNVGVQIVTLCVGVFLIWRISPTMTLIAMAALPLYALGSALFMGALRKNTELVRNSNAELQSRLEEKLTHVQTIQYYGQEAYESRRFLGRLQDHLKLAWRMNGLNTGLSVVLMIVSGVGATSVLLYGFWQFEAGVMKLGEVLAVYQMAALLFGPITMLTNTSVVIQTTAVVLSRIYEVLDLESDVKDAPDAVDADIHGEIRFDNVSLQYLEDGPVALKKVSFEVRNGESLAVLGPSGCGKSSIANLLQRFYDPTEGAVFVDGVDVQKLRLDTLRRSIGLAGQEARLFSGSVAENIAFGDPDVSQEEIERVTETVGLRETVAALPQGYKTTVGKGGATLGQDAVQRIAIARTLLKNASILVFDDSVSATTEEAEMDLYRSIEEAYSTQTLIIITNRVRTAETADRIAVFREGELVEFGSPEELKGQRGIYWRMFLHQTERPQEVNREVRLSTPEEPWPTTWRW